MHMETSTFTNYFPAIRSKHARSSTRLGMHQSSSRNRHETVINSPSQVRIDVLINECESQVVHSKNLRELINKMDRMLSQDFKNLQMKIKKQSKFSDENFVSDAVRAFRDEKKAFIYKHGRFISGMSSRTKFII